MSWTEIAFNVKDVIYIIVTVAGALSTFFVLKYKITKLEEDVASLKESEKLKDNDIKELSKLIFAKIDELIKQITDSNTLLKEHVAYHKGMEDAEHKLK